MIYLYHGTDVEFDTPIPERGRRGTDFGQGFYLAPHLVSWNFRHITNAQMIPKIKKVCSDNGYVCAEICTPQMLQEEVQDDA